MGMVPKSRFDAFSDGVFAIAITLLVLELAVPEGPENLLTRLGQEWPSYLGYLVSFAFIGGIWVAHSTLGRFLRRTDQVLVGLNLLLLLLVGLLPFTTNLMASHLTDSGEHVAVVALGINLLLAAIMINLMLDYAAREPELISANGGPELKAFARQRRVTLIVQGLATLLGLVLPAVAVVAYLVISVLILGEPIGRVVQSRRAAKRA